MGDDLAASDVPHLLRAFEASDWSSMELRTSGLTLVAGVVAPASAGGPAAVQAAPAATAAVEPPACEAVASAAPVVDREGLVAIAAPVMGAFYRAPAPGAAPYVEVGATVSADETVCIVEVMKLMNQVAAGVRGEVVEIVAADGDMVQEGQALIYVRPA